MLKKKTILNSNNNPVRVQFKKKQQEIKSVGNLIDAIKDADEDDLEDGNITKEIYQKIQLMEILILIFTSFGSMLCLLSVNLIFNNEKYELEFQYIYDFSNKSFLWVNIIFTVSCYFFVYQKAHFELTLLKCTNVVNDKSTLLSSNLLSSLLKEWLILSLHPYPFLTGIF